jgi:hypothetical protein
VRWDIANPKKKDGQVISFSQDLEQLKPLFDMDRMALAYQSFSPDGNRYVGLGALRRIRRKARIFVVPGDEGKKKRPIFRKIGRLFGDG